MKDFTRLPALAERSSWAVVIRSNIWSGFCFFVSSLFCNDAANAADAARQSAAIHKAPSHLAVPGTGYAVEEIPVPRGIAPEIGGLGFTPSGKLVVVTRRSGVLFATPAADPSKFDWKVFCDQSLHNANGLYVISESEILVSQMPELTRIRDSNGDGVADEYETVSPFNLSGAYHEVTAGPAPDGKGGYYVALNTASHSGFTFEFTRGLFSEVSRRGRNFASVEYRGWVVHIDSKGVTRPWAKGFRSPNGIAVDPAGQVWVTDNQGDFRSTNPLYHVEKDKFYGHPSSLVWDPEYTRIDSKRDPLKQPMEELDAMRTPEAVAFPYGFSRSPAEPVFELTGGKFGPFTGQMLVGDAAAPRIIRVMLEKVDGVWQGACADFYSSNGLRNGTNRMVFSPSGGELYVGQTMREWAGAMEGLQRVVFKGGRVFEVLAMRLQRNGFEVEFTEPVDVGSGDTVEAFPTEVYGYKYSSSYGSPEEGLSRVVPKSLQWSNDRRRVRLVYDALSRTKVYRITLSGIASRGESIGHPMVAYTVNRLLP
jgi:glucose/arabinose dehydrogenase